ncbi:MAG: hypothetical protein ACFFDF_00340 [Candidatus Odinarchaeota archaeon]
MEELTKNDYESLLTILNETMFKGSDVEYISLLKAKMQLKIKSFSQDNSKLEE